MGKKKETSKKPEAQKPEANDAKAPLKEDAKDQPKQPEAKNDPTPPKAPPKEPSAKVRVVLAKDSPVAGLLVAGVRVERASKTRQAALLSREDFERLKKEYKLQEAGKGEA